MYFVFACRIVERLVKRQSAMPLRQEDWESIQTAAEKDTNETVVHSFGGMCAFSNEVMGQETEGGGWHELQTCEQQCNYHNIRV